MSAGFSGKVMTTCVLALAWALAPCRTAASTFEQRREEILDFYTANISMFSRVDDRTGFAKSGIYHAMAHYERGEIETATEITNHIFDNPASASMFLLMAGMDIYLRYGQHMSQELKNKIRRYFETRSENFPFGSTENHKVMTAMAGFLAAETWPDWARGQSFKAACRDEIFKFVTAVAKTGIAEYDSPVYLAFDINALLSLYEFAQDADVRKCALVGHELLLADMAGEWVGGCWATSTLRTHDLNHDARDGLISGLTGYLYFGGPGLPAQSDGAGIMSAVSVYRLPSIIEIIGTDRSEPFTHRETHLAWHGARKTTYCNKTYGVYSQHDGNGSLFWSDQMHRAGVTWQSDTFGAKFVVKHGKSDIVGETPGNQVLQYKGVLVGVAKEAMTGYVPKDGCIIEQREENGWLFMDGGTCYMAFTSAGGYTWGADYVNTGVGAQYLIWNYSNFVENYRTLALGGVRQGWVIETAHPGEYDGFAAFVNAVRAKAAVDVSGVNNTDPRMKYTTVAGDVLEITFDGRGGIATDRRKVNGTALDFAAWPRMENPWVNCSLNGSSLIMQHGDYRRTYNFSDWSITETGTLDVPVKAVRPVKTGRVSPAAGRSRLYDLCGRSASACGRMRTGVLLECRPNGAVVTRIERGTHHE